MLFCLIAFRLLSFVYRINAKENIDKNSLANVTSFSAHSISIQILYYFVYLLYTLIEFCIIIVLYSIFCIRIKQVLLH